MVVSKIYFDLIILREMIQFDCCPGSVLLAEFFHVDANMLLQIARECIYTHLKNLSVEVQMSCLFENPAFSFSC